MIHPPAEFRLLSLISPSEARSARDNLGLRGYFDLVIHAFEELTFDARHGVRTRHRIAPQDLDFDDSDAQARSQRYRATPPFCIGTAFDWLARDIGGLGGHGLVDYGCGAGLVLLVGLKKGFGKVTGLEMSPALVDQCRANIDRFRRRHRLAQPARVLQVNAAFHAPPADATVFYFFHPFSGEYFDSALSLIRDSVRQAPRDIYVMVFQAAHFAMPGLALIAGITGVTIYSNRAAPQAFLDAG